VDYSNAWCRTLGSSVATALHEILQVVYSELLQVTDFRSALQSVAQLFSCQDYTYGDLLLQQEDIAGFCNQVDHDRMLQAIQFAVCRFCELQGQSLTSSLDIHQESLERSLRTFGGFWRSRSQKYRPIRLDHICSFSQYLLTHSYFSIGATVFNNIVMLAWDLNGHQFSVLLLLCYENGLFMLLSGFFVQTGVFIIAMWTIVFCFIQDSTQQLQVVVSFGASISIPNPFSWNMSLVMKPWDIVLIVFKTRSLCDYHGN
jgi:hypothetical protein